MIRIPRPMGLLDHRHEVVDVAELGGDGQKVADVVATVVHRRGVEGQQPDAVDAEPLQVVELFPRGPLKSPIPSALESKNPRGEQFVKDRPLVPTRVVEITDRGPGTQPRSAELDGGEAAQL